jgi:hypothetical protein
MSEGVVVATILRAALRQFNCMGLQYFHSKKKIAYFEVPLDGKKGRNDNQCQDLKEAQVARVSNFFPATGHKLMQYYQIL